MATYIVLFSFTDQGIRNVKQLPERIKAGTAAAEKLGIKVKDRYSTMGAYDAVLIVDAPTGSHGNNRTQTMRAYSADEMDRILAKIP